MKSQTDFRIRDALPSDAEQLALMYRPYVEQTATTFELDPPDANEFRKRIAKAQQNWAWLVAETSDGLAGYAYGGEHRARKAYELSVEMSVYLAMDATGQGIGGALYRELERRLMELGFCNAFAGITIPNPPSVRLHLSQGWRFVGVFPRIGFKFDQWHDVSWWSKKLRDRPVDHTESASEPG